MIDRNADRDGVWPQGEVGAWAWRWRRGRGYVCVLPYIRGMM